MMLNPNGYLGAPTNLVADAHKQGLQIYASGFSNDAPGSYNYSYDPTAEYAKFVDNSQFSVDGVITDFPPTCLMLFIFCSLLAYQKAVDDGTDIIDCSVQMSKDGVAFCLASADLAGDTTAMMPFIDRKANIPEIQPEAGVFSFSLSWSEIQSLKPQMTSPFMNNSMLRNPKPAVDEIKKYADAVTVPRASLVRVSNSFTIGSTEVVKEMHAANISVYVYQFRNEYVTLAFDYFSDPVVEIATFVQTVGVDGIITDYPGTAEPGALLSIVPPQIQPPAQAPGAAFQIQDVVHPPLPPVVSKPNDAPSPPAHEAPKSSGYTNVANMGISLIAMLVFGPLSMGC